MPVIFTRTWQGSTSAYNLDSNWDTADVPDAAGEAAIFADTGVTTVVVSAPVTPDSWNFSAAAQSYVISGSAVTLSAGISNLADGQLISIANNVGGAGGITQDGNSTLVLSGANTYTGATTVSAGTLQVDGSIATSATTVNSGATLGGNGTTGAVDVASAGTLAPGANAAGTLTTGNLSFAAGANFAVELGGTSPGVGGYDQVVVNGSVDLNGATLSVSILGGFNPASGTFIIIDNDGPDLTGTFAGLAEGATVTAAPGNTFTIGYSGGVSPDKYVVLTAVNDVAPVITSAATANENENTAAANIVYQTTVTDPDTVGRPIR